MIAAWGKNNALDLNKKKVHILRVKGSFKNICH